MKSKILFLFIYVFFFSKGLSQNTSGIIEYDFTFLGDTQPCTVIFNSERSKSITNRKDTLQNAKPKLDESFAIESKTKDRFGDICYKDLTAGVLKGREIVFSKKFLYEEPIPKMNWELKEDQKKIGKYNCQKAVVAFRGRIYEAWFTNEIPVSTGPWKFHGLPGLILEIKDSKNEVIFTARKVGFKPDLKINFVENGTKITFEEYKEIWLKVSNDAVNKALMMMEDKSVTIDASIDYSKFLEINFDNE